MKSGQIAEVSESLLFGNANSPFPSHPSYKTSRVKQIWAVGGGKGGVGKSMISASLAISLSRMGHDVVAMDLDLGGANLHTSLGIEMPKKTLSDFVSERLPLLSECLWPSGIPRLSLISGAQDSIAMANINTESRSRILTQLHDLPADYVILDLGAGTNLCTLDFFIAADVGVLAILPEPTSIENAYRFIKSVYYRKLALAPALRPIQNLVLSAVDPKNSHGIQSPADLFRVVNAQSPEYGILLKSELEKIQPKLILNQVRTQMDNEIGVSVKSVCKKYFGIDVDFMGSIEYDSAVWQSIRRKRPLMLEFPHSTLVSSFNRIAETILKRYGHVRNELLK